MGADVNKKIILCVAIGLAAGAIYYVTHKPKGEVITFDEVVTQAAPANNATIGYAEPAKLNFPDDEGVVNGYKSKANQYWKGATVETTVNDNSVELTHPSSIYDDEVDPKTLAPGDVPDVLPDDYDPEYSPDDVGGSDIFVIDSLQFGIERETGTELETMVLVHYVKDNVIADQDTGVVLSSFSDLDGSLPNLKLSELIRSKGDVYIRTPIADIRIKPLNEAYFSVEDVIPDNSD